MSRLENKRIVLKVDEVLLVLFWLLYFLPPCVERISSNLAKGLLLVEYGIFLLYVIRRKNYPFRLNRFIVITVLLMGWCMFSLLINSPFSLPSFIVNSCIPVIQLYVVMHCSVGGDGERGFVTLYRVACLYVVLNFCSMIFFPHGMFISSVGSSVERVQWIFGSKNNIPMYMIIFSTIIMITNYVREKNMYTWIYLFMSAYSICFGGGNGIEFFGGSSTGIVAIVVCIFIYWYLSKFEYLPRIFNMLNTVIITVFVYATILGGHTLPFINNLIMNVFNKSMSFSGRSKIWIVNIEKIKMSPIVGYGTNKFNAPVNINGIWTTTTYTYNMVLKYLLSYGVVALILIILLLLCIKKTGKIHIQLLNVGFIGIVIMGTMNEVDIPSFMMFPIAMYLLSEYELQNDFSDFKVLK